ncbi:MAG: hypothetical protein ACLP5H_06760 [Desulfomonilaceae bacterium]
MGAISVPEELKEMMGRIEEILDIVRIQNSILCQILPQSAKLGCQLQELSGLGKKLDIMNNSLEVIKDFSSGLSDRYCHAEPVKYGEDSLA